MFHLLILRGENDKIIEGVKIMWDVLAHMASWFGNVSTYDISPIWFHQPKMPEKLLDKSEK